MPLKSQLFNTILNEVTKGVQNLQQGGNRDNDPRQQRGGFVGDNSGYGAGYQPEMSSSGYPGGSYPGQQGGYPGQPPLGYPRQPGDYPGQQGSYPGQPQSGYPGQLQGGYPNQGSGGYPGQQGSYPGQLQGGYSSQGSGGYPGQMSGSYGSPSAGQGSPPAIGFKTSDPNAYSVPQPQIGFIVPNNTTTNTGTYPNQTHAEYSGNTQREVYTNSAPSSYSSAPSASDNNGYHVMHPSNPKYASFGDGKGPKTSGGPYGQYSAAQQLFNRSHLGMQGSPTIRPYQAFNANGDAEILRKAMKGLGCDKSKVINVLCARANFQRQQIATAYKTLYGKDLINDLKSELSGDFEDLILALMEPPARYDAQQLHKAMQGLGTKESVLIEIMCSRTNAQIIELRNVYQQMYGRSLEDDLIGETSGHFKRLLVSLCAGGRDESMQTDPLRANQDARKLYSAGERRLGTDESCFNAILAAQNYAQLRIVFQEYQKVTNHTIEKAIEAEFSGDIKDGLLAIIACVQNKPAYFAALLYNSMVGLGTRDSDLIRVIVTRSEVDLADVRLEFERKYKKSLESFIKGDCSGAYKDGLIALVRGN